VDEETTKLKRVPLLNSAAHTMLMAWLRMSQRSCFQNPVTGITPAVETDEASSIRGVTGHGRIFDNLLKKT